MASALACTQPYDRSTCTSTPCHSRHCDCNAELQRCDTVRSYDWKSQVLPKRKHTVIGTFHGDLHSGVLPKICTHARVWTHEFASKGGLTGRHVHEKSHEKRASLRPTTPLRYSHADLIVGGWLAKRGRRVRSRVWRFFTLRGSELCSARNERSHPTWLINVRGAKVFADSREIVVRHDDITVSLTAPSADAHRRWLAALEAVSHCVLDFYDKGKRIAQGERSEVFIGRDKLRNERCAIKKFRWDARRSEVAVLYKVSHPNIAQLYDVFDASTHLHVVMEYVGGGDLLERITDSVRLYERSARHVVRAVLLALRYLHNRQIVHGDIEPENILCVSWTSPDRVKLAGFGMARLVDDRVVLAQCGSAYYRAPEGVHDTPADMWACGVVMFVMLAGKLPFYGDTDAKFKRRLHAGVKFPSEEWASVSYDAKNLLQGMLDPCPDTRLTADQALHHRWLVGEHWR